MPKKKGAFTKSGGALRSVPLAALKKALTDVNLHKNMIVEVPPVIGDMRLLRCLDLSKNLLRNLPSEMAQLDMLCVLNLADNQFKEVPHEIAGLPSLTELSLAGNRLSSLGVTLATLPMVVKLDLSRNQLSTVCGEDLPPLLWSVDLSSNRLHTLSECAHLLNLGLLAIRDNPIPVTSSVHPPVVSLRIPVELLYSARIDTGPPPGDFRPKRNSFHVHAPRHFLMRTCDYFVAIATVDACGLLPCAHNDVCGIVQLVSQLPLEILLTVCAKIVEARYAPSMEQRLGRPEVKQVPSKSVRRHQGHGRAAPAEEEDTPSAALAALDARALFGGVPSDEFLSIAQQRVRLNMTSEDVDWHMEMTIRIICVNVARKVLLLDTLEKTEKNVALVQQHFAWIRLLLADVLVAALVTLKLGSTTDHEARALISSLIAEHVPVDGGAELPAGKSNLVASIVASLPALLWNSSACFSSRTCSAPSPGSVLWPVLQRRFGAT